MLITVGVILVNAKVAPIGFYGFNCLFAIQRDKYLPLYKDKLRLKKVYIVSVMEQWEDFIR